ncbi:MAG TPA: hypothetical protein VM286_08155 [Candidatus Thermoplasmatota archaeon]|nr:hypothetical protein [Candidatus Thermoplasmatota archaeon]
MRALALVLLLVPVAGCAQHADVSVAKDGGMGPAAHTSHLNATAPAWQVGQFWVHKWTLVGDSLTFLVKTVVSETADGGFTLASDNQTMAAFHGAFVFPTLGHFTPELVQSAGETRFPWYHFPLTPNSTWTDSAVTFDGVAERKMDVQGKVTSVTFGANPVYHVEMRSAGVLVASYDYDPGTQWFNEALFYNATGQVQFSLLMQQTGRGFKGTTYDDSGVQLLDHQDLVVPAGGVAQPNPKKEFTMTAEQNRLLAFIISFAAGGGHDAEIVAPDGHRYGSQAFDAVLFPLYNDSQVLIAPGQAGTWHTTSAGAGVFVAGGVIQAWGLKERAIEV